MDLNTFGSRLKLLRTKLSMTQKEFAQHLGIPQPSLSSYENGKNSPTIDVVMQIAETCNISLDWLCGRDSKFTLGNLGDVADFFYQLLVETKDINCDLVVHDKLTNGTNIETIDETDDKSRWWTRLTFYGNDKKHTLNPDICNIVKKVSEAKSDIESFSCSPESYEAEKKRTIDYYTYPLTKKEMPELSRDERLKKHIEYLKKNELY